MRSVLPHTGVRRLQRACNHTHCTLRGAPSTHTCTKHQATHRISSIRETLPLARGCRARIARGQRRTRITKIVVENATLSVLARFPSMRAVPSRESIRARPNCRLFRVGSRILGQPADRVDNSLVFPHQTHDAAGCGAWQRVWSSLSTGRVSLGTGVASECSRRGGFQRSGFGPWVVSPHLVGHLLAFRAPRGSWVGVARETAVDLRRRISAPPSHRAHLPPWHPSMPCGRWSERICAAQRPTPRCRSCW